MRFVVLEKLKYRMRCQCHFPPWKYNLLLRKKEYEYRISLPLDSRLRHEQLTRFWSSSFYENILENLFFRNQKQN